MKDPVEPCPPIDFGFHYGREERFSGRGLQYYRCGMYLMLDYKGSENSLDILQEMFRPSFTGSTPDLEVLCALVLIMAYSLVDFDDEFYDGAYACIFSTYKEDGLTEEELSWSKEHFLELYVRGFELPRAAATKVGGESLRCAIAPPN